jgi:hypothetical protein
MPHQKPGTNPEIWAWGASEDDMKKNPPPKTPPAGTSFGYSNLFLQVPPGTDPNN